MACGPTSDTPPRREYVELLSDVKSNRGRVGYGIEAFDARDPMAWPGFATREDVTGLPPTVVSVNECDPLRDEGVAFYRLLLLGRRREPGPRGARHHARHGDVPDRVSRDQSRRRARPGRLRERLTTTESHQPGDDAASVISSTDTHRRSATDRSIAEQTAATLAPTAKSGLHSRASQVAARSHTWLIRLAS